MNRTRYTWLIIVTLLIILACSSTDPRTLPNRPVLFGPASQNSSQVGGTTLHVLPAANLSSASLPLQIDSMRVRAYPGSDIVIEATLDPGVNYSRYYVSYLSDGLKIYALMTVPNDPKPPTGWPVIIFNHGYIPPAVYRTTQRYIAYVDQIARNGYIVFKSDYRGHDRSEGKARGGYTQPDYTIDVLNAVASMKRYPDADPNRIGMWGHSMGGYITLRSMVITKDIKAGVIWAGVIGSYPDMLTRWRRSPSAAATPTPSARSWRYS